MKKLIAVVALALAMPAFAQGSRGETTVDVYIGPADLDDYGAVRPDDDSMWGIRVGRSVTDDWSWEITGQRMEGDSDFGDFDLDSLRVNVLYNFRAYKTLRPYVTGGLGLEQFDVLGEDEIDFGINLGGGFRWYTITRFGIRVDARAVFSESGADVFTQRVGKGSNRHQITRVRFDNTSQSNIEGSVGFFLAF